MKFIRFTHVDSVTGISVAKQPAANGLVFPAVVGLEFKWARESQYPTKIPALFGTCPDTSDIDVDGVTSVFNETDFNLMHADELNLRPKPLSFNEMVIDAVQARLDAFAKEHGYDNIQSACTYVTSTEPRYATDAATAVAMRDSTWATLHSLFDETVQGTRQMPSTVEEVIELLPVLVWPN
jgi:hypothetical protein